MKVREQTFSRTGRPKRKSAEVRLDNPKGRCGPDSSRRHQLQAAHVVRVRAKPMHVLKQVKRKKEPPDSAVIYHRVDHREDEAVPTVKVTKARRRVAEVSLGKSQFYNPAYAISKAIRDSLDPEKVLGRQSEPVQVLQAAPEDAGQGFKIHVRAVLEERESAKLYRLPSGWDMWIPRHWILEEGRYFIRIPAGRRWNIKALRLPPKFQTKLTREQIRARLLAKRG